MSVPSTSQAPKSWDTLIIAGKQFPGFPEVRVSGSNDVEKKKPKGGTGASTTFQGRNAATVKITLTLYDILPGERTDPAADAWTQLQAVLPQIFAKRAKDEKGLAMAIEHPMTSLFGIEAIKIEKVEGEKKGRDIIITIEATEFLPPAAGAAGSATKTETTLDPRNQSLAADLPARPTRPSSEP